MTWCLHTRRITIWICILLWRKHELLQYLLKLSIISFVIFAICQKKNKKKWSITSNDIRKFLTLFCSFVVISEIWGMASFSTAKASNLRKFSLRKLYFHQFAQVFSLESFLLYDTNYCCSMQWCQEQYMDNLKQAVYNVVDEPAYILRTLSLPPLATLSPSGLQSTENT